MKIVGHRGAAGLHLENSITGIKKAKSLGVDAIEFDARLTKDKVLVLCHDIDLARISNDTRKVDQLTVAEIKKIKLRDNESIVTLAKALDATKSIPVIIDLKSVDTVEPLQNVLKNRDLSKITIASSNHNEAYWIKKLIPGIKVYLVENHRPFEILQIARNLKMDGLDLSYWLLNPLTYYIARRLKLEIMVYTVNSVFVAKVLNFLYPKIAICTDYPDKFLKK